MASTLFRRQRRLIEPEILDRFRELPVLDQERPIAREAGVEDGSPSCSPQSAHSVKASFNAGLTKELQVSLTVFALGAG
jgi:hypothetical protein